MRHLDRRSFVSRLAGAAGAFWVAPRARTIQASPAAARPNIVFMMADDLGYGDLSGYGRADVTTPVLDRLAVEGMRFTHAYSAAPICSPTRVGFMTGRYPARHPAGLREPLTGDDHDLHIGLEAAHPTVSSLLRDAGYTNALFGKWHLGVGAHFHPNRHGFHEFFGPLSGAVDHVSHHSVQGGPDLWENDRPMRAEGYLQDLVIDRAVSFIQRRPEPFFLSIQGTAPHWPWQRRGDAPVGGDLRGGAADRYPDMLRILDEGVGRVLRALEEAAVAERTLVVFTSDNGGERHSNMAGLAGRKGNALEGGIRVPAVARWPGVVPAGVTSRQALTTLDWTATFLAAAGAAAAASHPLAGIDLLPLLTGSAAPRDRSLFWRTFQRTQEGAARIGTWKYYRDGDEERLFDLARDPGERQDLKDEHPERFEELRSAYAAWDADMLRPVPLRAR